MGFLRPAGLPPAGRWPHAPRNLWFSAGEELPEISPTAVTTAAAAAAVRRRSGGGEGDRNEARSPKN